MLKRKGPDTESGASAYAGPEFSRYFAAAKS